MFQNLRTFSGSQWWETSLNLCNLKISRRRRDEFGRQPRPLETNLWPQDHTSSDLRVQASAQRSPLAHTYTIKLYKYTIYTVLPTYTTTNTKPFIYNKNYRGHRTKIDLEQSKIHSCKWSGFANNCRRWCSGQLSASGIDATLKGFPPSQTQRVRSFKNDCQRSKSIFVRRDAP